jgi:hypothetical protein
MWCMERKKRAIDEAKLLREILHELRHLRHEIGLLFHSAQLRFVDEKGDLLMPATIKVGATASAVFTEFDGPNGTGNPVPAIGPVNFASDNQAVATVDANGLATGVGAGSANISALDGGNGLTASDVLTVEAVAPVAVSATLALTAN